MEARSGGHSTGQSLNSEINVTPLVDVMLVVLIIFMVVTPMLKMGLRVDLPEARHVTQVSDDHDQALTVILRDDGQMFLGTDPIDASALATALRLRFKSDSGLQLQLKADRSVPYGKVKEVLQAGREAGFQGAFMVAQEAVPLAGAAARRSVARVAFAHESPAGQEE